MNWRVRVRARKVLQWKLSRELCVNYQPLSLITLAWVFFPFFLFYYYFFFYFYFYFLKKDSSALCAEIKAAHHLAAKANERCTVGIEINEGVAGDVTAIKESLRVKRQVLLSGAESAELILRIDQIITAPPRQRQQGR